MGLKKDLVGKTFGKLTVNRDTGKRQPSNGEVYWNCSCNCGKETDVRSGHLISGRTISCGCSSAEINRTINLTGKRFGKLIVMQDTGRRSKGRIGNVIWHCVCDCGGTVDVSSANLPNGAVKSCGCLSESYIASELKIYFIYVYGAKKEYNIVKNFTGQWLPYDIYIPMGKNPEINGYYIEINGEQHYVLGEFHRLSSIKTLRTPFEEFQNQKSRDKKKRIFARKNGIYIEVDLRKIHSVNEAINYIEERISS